MIHSGSLALDKGVTAHIPGNTFMALAVCPSVGEASPMAPSATCAANQSTPISTCDNAVELRLEDVLVNAPHLSAKENVYCQFIADCKK